MSPLLGFVKNLEYLSIISLSPSIKVGCIDAEGITRGSKIKNLITISATITKTIVLQKKPAEHWVRSILNTKMRTAGTMVTLLFLTSVLIRVQDS